MDTSLLSQSPAAQSGVLSSGNPITQENPITQTNPITANNSLLSSQDLNNITQAQDLINSNPSMTNVPSVTKQPSLLERLLPAAGSILGGLVPIPGLDIGTAAAGGAGGQALANVLEGKKALEGNDITSGLLGGAGQGIGEYVAGPLLSKAGGALAGMGDAAADDTGALSDVDKAVANKNNFGALSDKLQNMTNLGKNQQFLDSMGIDSTDPMAMQAASKAGLDINNSLDSALSTSKPIDMSDFGNQVFDHMKANGVTELSTSPLGKAISDSGIETDPLSGLPTTDQMEAPQVRSLSQAVNTQMRGLQGQMEAATRAGNIPVANDLESNYNSLKGIYTDLQDKLYTNNPEVDQAVKGLTLDDNARQALVGKYGDQLGNYVADTVNNAQSGKDLVSAMRPFAQMGDASDVAANDLQNVSASSRAVARAKAAAPEAGGNSLLSPKTAMEGLGGYETIKDKPAIGLPLMALGMMGGGGASAAGGLLSGIGGSALPGAVGAGVASAAGQVPSGAGMGTGVTSNQGAPMNLQGSPVMQALNESLQTPLLGGLSQLSALLPIAQKMMAAEQAVNQLPGYLNAAGGAQGPIGGLETRLGSMFTGGPAASYGAQAQQAQSAVANAMGMPASSVATPSIMQNQPAAQQTINNMQQLLSAFGLNSNNSSPLLSQASQ